ncbi:MAG: DUF1351 domain-containing protein [Rectinema sp.]
MQTLLFDEKTHTYTIDGEVIPRVTQIVAAVTGKDLSKAPKTALYRAKERGEAIHKDVSEGKFGTPEGQWVRDQRIGPCKCEVMGAAIVSGFVFAGTCDILYDGGLGIDDIKSQVERDILSWTLQLNLYRVIFKTNGALRVLHCPKSGNYHVVPIQTLSEEKIAEIIDAYREGRILDDSFLSMVERPEAESLELVVSKYTVGELTTNAKAILETVKRNLAHYKAENYSEANIADAKRDKAELNAAAKKLNDKRIEIERDWMKPLNEFKDTITAACQEIKTTSAQIDATVKEVESREKAEKRQQIEKFFAEKGCQYFTLEKIWSEAWLNKGAKMKDIQAEIVAKIQQTENDLAVMDRINEPEAKAYYLDTLSLDAALKRADDIKANRERLAAIEKARQERETAARNTQPALEVSTDDFVEAPFEQEPTTEPEMLERTMWVRGTYEQIVALGDYMNDHGIEFRKLKGEEHE